MELTDRDGRRTDAGLRGPADSPRGGVVVVQEAFGVTTHIEECADRLADAGWLAVAPAFFHRQGSPVIAYDDLAEVMPVMGQITAAAHHRSRRAFDYLNGQGVESHHIGVVGFCMGGSVTFYAATLRPLGAAVTFYGGGVSEGRFGLPALVDQAPDLASPWLGLLRRSRPGHPGNRRGGPARRRDPSPVDTEILRYADAQHGFNCNDRPAVYHAEAAADAWRRTLEFFDAHMG